MKKNIFVTKYNTLLIYNPKIKIQVFLLRKKTDSLAEVTSFYSMYSIRLDLSYVNSHE